MAIRGVRWAAGSAALAFGLSVPVLATAEDEPTGAEAGQIAGQTAGQGGEAGDAEDRLLRAERVDQQADDEGGGAARMPNGFDRLGLTEREQAEVLRVAAQYDRQAERLLQQFAELHAEAIGLEAIALADTMKRGDGAIASAEQGGDKGRSGHGEQRTAGFRPGDAAGSDKPAAKIKEIGESSPFAGPSAETWKKLHELHLQVVKVEAQKLAAVEKLLSTEQLGRLHGFRSESRSGHAHGAGQRTEPRPDRPDLQNQDADEERRDRNGDRAAGAGGVEAGASDGRVDPNRSNEPLPQRRELGED